VNGALEEPVHTFWKVALKRGRKEFAVDLTSAQYGYHEPVTSLSLYSETRTAFERTKYHFESFKEIMLKHQDSMDKHRARIFALLED